MLNDKLTVVNKKVQNLNDQSQSLDGRISRISPLNDFGGDNTIHGTQWLAEQSPNTFRNCTGNVSNKKEMYEIAMRYNHYLKQPLAYYTMATGTCWSTAALTAAMQPAQPCAECRTTSIRSVCGEVDGRNSEVDKRIIAISYYYIRAATGRPFFVVYWLAQGFKSGVVVVGWGEDTNPNIGYVPCLIWYLVRVFTG